MIRLTLTWFVFIYLAVFLAGILVFWIGYEMLRKSLSQSHHPLHCRICGVTLAHSSTPALVRCPSCGNLNEAPSQGGL